VAGSSGQWLYLARPTPSDVCTFQAVSIGDIRRIYE
jgi:hypothetical protein